MSTPFTQDTTYQLRIDKATKKASFAVFKELGMTPAEGVRVFLHTVANTRSIPFSIHTPNAETQEAFAESLQEKGNIRFASTGQMFDHLDSLL